MRADRRLNRGSAPPRLDLGWMAPLAARNEYRSGEAKWEIGIAGKRQKLAVLHKRCQENNKTKKVVANSSRRRALRMLPLDSATGELANCWVEKIRTGRGSNPWTAVDHTWLSSQIMTLRQIRRPKIGGQEFVTTRDGDQRKTSRDLLNLDSRRVSRARPTSRSSLDRRDRCGRNAQLTAVGRDEVEGATEHACSAATTPLLERFQGRSSGWDEDAKRVSVLAEECGGQCHPRQKRFLAASNDVVVGLCNGTDRWLTVPKRREGCCYLACVLLKNGNEWLAKVRWASVFPWKRRGCRSAPAVDLPVEITRHPPRGPCSPPFPNAAAHKDVSSRHLLHTSTSI